MKQPSYRAGVKWIACNDNAHDDSAANPEAEDNVAGYISTLLLADLFGMSAHCVAKDVMRLRRVEAERRA